jgi:glycosyltransferase involved in cell wall biosynthesis
MAAQIPVISADNSSLREVGGNAVLYFNSQTKLEENIKKVLNQETLRSDLINKGLDQIKKFSWEKCARETLDYLKH